MKMALAEATTPAGYLAELSGWQRAYAAALHAAVVEAVPAFDARIKWGHIEPRLRPGGKFEMATLARVKDSDGLGFPLLDALRRSCLAP